MLATRAPSCVTLPIRHYRQSSDPFLIGLARQHQQLRLHNIHNLCFALRDLARREPARLACRAALSRPPPNPRSIVTSGSASEMRGAPATPRQQAHTIRRQPGVTDRTPHDSQSSTYQPMHAFPLWSKSLQVPGARAVLLAAARKTSPPLSCPCPAEIHEPVLDVLHSARSLRTPSSRDGPMWANPSASPRAPLTLCYIEISADHHFSAQSLLLLATVKQTRTSPPRRKNMCGMRGHDDVAPSRRTWLWPRPP